MLPIKTKLSIPTEISSSQNTVIPDNDEPQMCLLPSNLNRHTSWKQHCHRNANHHIPSAMIHEYIAPFQSEWDVNNKMMPFGYYLQSGRYINDNNGNLHQILPYSVSLNHSFISRESSASVPNCNGVYSTQKIQYENLSQPCPVANQPHIRTPSYSLPTASSSSITTSVAPSAKTQRKYSRRVVRPPAEQQLSQYSNTSAEPIFSHHWSSLPLPSMVDTLTRPSECTWPVDLTRPSNFAPMSLPDLPISSDPSSTIMDSTSNSTTVQQHSSAHSTINTFERYQTFRQYLSDQRCSHMQTTINNCSTSNLSYNPPSFLTPPHEHYYMLPSHPMPIDIPTVTCSTPLPELNTTFSPLSFPNNMKKVRKKRSGPRKSKDIQNSAIESQMDENNMAPISSVGEMSVVKRHLQKKSKIENNRTKTLLRHMQHRNNLAILKFMIQKRKQQQISNKKLPEVKTEKIVSQTVDINVSKLVEMKTELPNIVASSLKITLNTARKIDSISLHYHQRHKPEIETKHSLITSTNTENKLGLLIEAVNFIELYNGKSKLALESIE